MTTFYLLSYDCVYLSSLVTSLKISVSHGKNDHVSIPLSVPSGCSDNILKSVMFLVLICIYILHLKFSSSFPENYFRIKTLFLTHIFYFSNFSLFINSVIYWVLTTKRYRCRKMYLFHVSKVLPIRMWR